MKVCGCESHVACGAAVATLFLDIGEEVENELRIDLIEGRSARPDPQALLAKMNNSRRACA